MEYQILANVLAKSIIAKTGSDDFTNENFLVMASIDGGIKVYWSLLLF